MTTKVERNIPDVVGPVEEQFKLVTYKTVKDISGNDVQVEDKVEVVTVQNLEAEKSRLLAQIAVIDGKLEEIAKL